MTDLAFFFPSLKGHYGNQFWGQIGEFGPPHFHSSASRVSELNETARVWCRRVLCCGCLSDDSLIVNKSWTIITGCCCCKPIACSSSCKRFRIFSSRFPFRQWTAVFVGTNYNAQTLRSGKQSLYSPSERSELARYHVMLYFPSVCEQSINRLWRHRCTASVNLFARYNCFSRNVFDSCVKSWENFHSDNILLETSFSWLSDDIVRFKIQMGVVKKCTKMSTPFLMDFQHTPVTQQPSLSMTSLTLAGVYCASTLGLLGRCLCKHVDVYIITLSCTWRIYALSECLLVC